MASQPRNPCMDGEVAEITPEVDHTILEKVDSVQEAIDCLNKRASVEILKVEQKYNKLRKPQYKMRADLLAKIPNFWSIVFKNHSHLRVVITEEDQKALAYLKGVEVQEFDDITSGYKINFFFNENPFFKNECLTKEYHVSDDGDPTATSTKIEWNPGMDLTEMADADRQTLKRRYPHQQGFFRWFAFDRSAVGDVIGDYIKDELWPNPLQYFLNPESVSDEEVEDDDDEEEDEDDEDCQDLAYEGDGGEYTPKSS